MNHYKDIPIKQAVEWKVRSVFFFAAHVFSFGSSEKNSIITTKFTLTEKPKPKTHWIHNFVSLFLSPIPKIERQKFTCFFADIWKNVWFQEVCLRSGNYFQIS